MTDPGMTNPGPPPRNRNAGPPDDMPRGLKHNLPLVPAASIASRALVTVIAIMTYLASLTAGAAFLIGDASSGWQQSVSQEMTIQIRPVAGRDIEADVNRAADIARATAGVASVRVYSRAESERMLEPWLGAGLDLRELPVPRLIELHLGPGAAPDMSRLRAALAEKTPVATLDDHQLWIGRLATMARSMVAGAMIIFALVLTAMALAVAFATRGAMAGNREIIDVLHFVGAADRFIAGEFQRHFLRLGLRGGSFGGIAAILTFLGLGRLAAWWTASPGGDQMEALFGTFSLGLWGYLSIAAITAGIAVLTGLMSRTIVYRHLQGLS